MEYSDTKGSGASPFKKMRERRGSPSRMTADTIDCSSGAQLGLPRNASESVRILISDPLLSIMYSNVLSLSATEKAMRLPLGEMAGPPTIRECAPLRQISRVVPCVTDHIPCLSPCQDRYKRRLGPRRGVALFAETSERPPAAGAAARSSVMGMRQRLVRALAIVATRRALPALAASDV